MLTVIAERLSALAPHFARRPQLRLVHQALEAIATSVDGTTGYKWVDAAPVVQQNLGCVTEFHAYHRYAGERVRILPGSERNIKITVPTDIVTAEAIYADVMGRGG